MCTLHKTPEVILSRKSGDVLRLPSPMLCVFILYIVVVAPWDSFNLIPNSAGCKRTPPQCNHVLQTKPLAVASK